MLLAGTSAATGTFLACRSEWGPATPLSDAVAGGSKLAYRAVLAGHVCLVAATTYVAVLGSRSHVVTAQQDLGFEAAGLVMISPQGRARQTLTPSERDWLVHELSQLAGVEAAAAGALPLRSGRTPVTVSQGPAATADELRALSANADSSAAGAGYFDTVGISILAGRGFRAARDVFGRSAVVSRSLAQSLGDVESLLGRQVWVAGAPVRVVGIAAEVWAYGPEWGPAPLIYMFAPPRGTFVAKIASAQSSGALERIAAVAGEVIGPNEPVQITSADDRVRQAMVWQRSQALLSGALGLLMLGLASASTLGAAHTLAHVHRGEVAIRMLLGASLTRAVSGVMGRLGPILVAGCLLGLAGGVAVGHAASHLWYGVTAFDAASLILAAVAAVLPLAAAPALLAGMIRTPRVVADFRA
jgi:putative ABC transport system permease protein